MSIKIGINGTASFKNVIDVFVGTSEKTKQDINFVKDWNKNIIWQRAIPLTPQNTTITISPTSYSESGSQKPWSYTKRPTVTGVSVNGVALDSGKYTVSYSENSSGSITGSGSVTAYVRITAKEGSGYSGYVDKNYTISYTYEEAKIDITGKCTINLSQASKTLADQSAIYEASDSDLTIDVSSVYYNTYTKLTKDTDYTVTYHYPEDRRYTHTTEDKKGKEVTVEIKGRGNYSGSATTMYTVYHEYVIPSEHLIVLFNPSTSAKYANMLDGSSGSHLGEKTLPASVTCTCFGGKYNYLFLEGGAVYRSRTFAGDWENVGNVGKSVTACCYTGTRLVGTTATQPGKVVYSTDGSSWSESTGVYSAYFTKKTIVYANGKVYAPATGKLLVSTDNGEYFTDYTPTGWGAFKMIYGNGIFVMFGGGSSGDNVYTSSDPTVSITKASIDMDTQRGTPCFGNGMFCILGSENGSSYSPYVSTNGTDWTKSQLSSQSYQDICFANGSFYLAKWDMNDTSVLKCTDGLNFVDTGISAGHVYDRINY